MFQTITYLEQIFHLKIISVLPESKKYLLSLYTSPCVQQRLIKTQKKKKKHGGFDIAEEVKN